MSIRENVNAAIKTAMVNKDKVTLQTLRLISAAFKQIEVDQRVEITDDIALRELVRQVKQRQDVMPRALILLSMKRQKSSSSSNSYRKHSAKMKCVPKWTPC